MKNPTTTAFDNHRKNDHEQHNQKNENEYLIKKDHKSAKSNSNLLAGSSSSSLSYIQIRDKKNILKRIWNFLLYTFFEFFVYFGRLCMKRMRKVCLRFLSRTSELERICSGEKIAANRISKIGKLNLRKIFNQNVCDPVINQV
jgi:hypothetical protein